MKKIIKINGRKWRKIIIAGTALGIIFSLAGCGKEDTQFLSEIQSVEESSNLEEDTAGTDERNAVSNAQDAGTDERNAVPNAQDVGTDEQNTAAKAQTQETEKFYVHICGAVKEPGVYTVEANARIYEAVALAGGFREDACTEYLNQAASVIDGSQIRIPTLEEVKTYEEQGISTTGVMTGSSGKDAATTVEGTKTETLDALVNLNTATEEQLCTLTGIGSAKASAIISYREQTGGFQNVEELLNVDGIKSGTFEKIKDKIRV